MATNCYVYAHLDLDGKCFYIGKGSGHRCKDGVKSRSKEWHSYTENGFQYKILVSGVSSKKAIELERSFCKQVGYENLANAHPTFNKKHDGYSKGWETRRTKYGSKGHN